MIRTFDDAIGLLRRERVVMLVATPGYASLVEEVIGEAVEGSWWAHPQGGLVYSLAESLEASPEVLVAKLVAGKVTFVHQTLWPALYRIVGDPASADAARRALSPAAKKLFAKVERDGEIGLETVTKAAPAEARAELRKAKQELEARHLVHSFSHHTDKGRHETRLRRWSAWASASSVDVVAEAAAMSREDALATLRAAKLELDAAPRARATTRAPARRK